jgi:hypothetical protein
MESGDEPNSASYLFASSSVGSVIAGSPVKYTFPSGSHFSAGDFISVAWHTLSGTSYAEDMNATTCWIYNTLAEVSASF